MENRYWSINALARLWGCREESVRELVLTGALPAFRIGSRWKVSDEVRLAYERGERSQVAAQEAAKEKVTKDKKR